MEKQLCFRAQKSRIQNPESELMYYVLKNIKLIVSFENEKARKFYGKFNKLNDNEANNIMRYNSLIFKKMI